MRELKAERRAESMRADRVLNGPGMKFKIEDNVIYEIKKNYLYMRKYNNSPC